MLPLHLSIEGLYSYQQKQEIDFISLTEAGLFGIFGTVGSGKSSVLEAISFALYGETERLNTKEKRTYNMMNLKSNHVVIDFEFLNFEKRKFRFVAQWRRKKKFHETADYTRTAYEWIDGSWLPLESNDGSLVTNLSYSNFRRTIIIPQGQFKEFMELRGKDRSEMMKEIFMLNQYDLGPKVSIMLADTNRKLEHLKGALSGFEEVNNDVIEAKNVQFRELEISLVHLRDEYNKIDIQFKALQIAKQNRIDLAVKGEQLQTLEQKKIQIQNIEKELNEFELVTKHFREHINNLSSLISSKNTLLTKIEGLKENKDAVKLALEDVESKLEDILPEYESIDILKAQIQDIKRIIQNIDFARAKSEKEQRILNGVKFLDEQKKVERKVNDLIFNLEQEIEIAKNERINSVDLLAIDTWYQRNEQFYARIFEENKRIQDVDQQIQQLKNKYTFFGFSETNWQTEIESQYQNLEEKLQVFHQKEIDLRLKYELSQYIHNLHDGEPCPLCGALEHPTPMETKTLDDKFSALEIDKKSIQGQKEILDKSKSDLAVITRMITDKSSELIKIKLDIVNIDDQQTSHQASFIWQDFDKNNRLQFDAKKTEMFSLEKQIQEKEKNLKLNRDQLTDARDNMQKSERRINDLQNEINVLTANINQNIAQIQVLQVKDMALAEQDSLDKESILLQQRIQQIETDYHNFTKKLLQYKTQYAQIKGAYIEAQEQYAQYAIKLKETQTQLNNALLELQYPDVATVKSILDKKLNVNESRKSIQDFQVAYNTLQNRIQDLQKLANEDNYSDEMYDQLSNLIILKKEEVEVQIGLYGALKEDLERLTIELAKKQELRTAFQKLESRKENLKILDNMFRGNGFVNYVSSIHLLRLCEIANNRFHRLTKNQLSLVINENNEFEVIDYLNNGYRRSAKTLSGGQAFQASLCLALALAENIQSLNKADKNFFFIDEGFGTQDSESINTVFDTLQYLHQENRVVGIISHVEELKERMPRAITVVKDLEKGSHIVVN